MFEHGAHALPASTGPGHPCRPSGISVTGSHWSKAQMEHCLSDLGVHGAVSYSYGWLHAFEQGLHASVPAYHLDWSEKYPSGHAWQSSKLDGSWALVVEEEEEEEEEEEGGCADAHVYGLPAGQLVHDDAPRTAANRPPATSTTALSCAAAA